MSWASWCYLLSPVYHFLIFKLPVKHKWTKTPNINQIFNPRSIVQSYFTSHNERNNFEIVCSILNLLQWIYKNSKIVKLSDVISYICFSIYITVLPINFLVSKREKVPKVPRSLFERRSTSAKLVTVKGNNTFEGLDINTFKSIKFPIHVSWPVRDSASFHYNPPEEDSLNSFLSLRT